MLRRVLMVLVMLIELLRSRLIRCGRLEPVHGPLVLRRGRGILILMLSGLLVRQFSGVLRLWLKLRMLIL